MGITGNDMVTLQVLMLSSDYLLKSLCGCSHYNLNVTAIRVCCKQSATPKWLTWPEDVESLQHRCLIMSEVIVPSEQTTLSGVLVLFSVYISFCFPLCCRTAPLELQRLKTNSPHGSAMLTLHLKYASTLVSASHFIINILTSWIYLVH